MLKLLMTILVGFRGVIAVSAHEEHGTGHRAGPENTNNLAHTPAANVKLSGRIDPFPGNNHYTDVWGEGNYAYIGSFDHEDFAIIDISDATAPALAGVYHGSTNGICADIQVKNGIAYMACDGPSDQKASGVHIVNVSDPRSPVLLSQITAAQNGFNVLHNLYLDGQFLYLANFRTPIVKVFNVSQPSAPKFVRDIRTTDTDRIHDITVINDRLYTSGWGGRTDIYDVSDVAARVPVRLGSINTGTTSHSSWVNQDGTILATCSEMNPRELRIYNIADPKNPALLSRTTSSTFGLDAVAPHNPVIMGDLLFVSWYQAGLQVFNIRNPAKPLLVGAFDTFPGGVSVPGAVGSNELRYDGCWGVYPLLGLDKVLLSDQDGGLFIVDATRLGGPDADGDRLPDLWEAQYSLDASRDDAQEDRDSDGLDNITEFLSGGNPMVHDQPVRLTRIEKLGTEVRMTVSARDGRLYSVEGNTRLTTAGWTLMSDEIQCTNGVATLTYTNAMTGPQFYRLRIRP